MSNVSSTDYERFVQEVIGELFGVEIHHQKLFIGKVSQREIRVDLSFTLKVGGADFLVVVECKRYRDTVSVDDVEEFHSKLDDIGAHKELWLQRLGIKKGPLRPRKVEVLPSRY